MVHEKDKSLRRHYTCRSLQCPCANVSLAVNLSLLLQPLPCQDLTMFVNRISELVKHMVQQMGSLYSTEG